MQFTCKKKIVNLTETFKGCSCFTIKVKVHISIIVKNCIPVLPARLAVRFMWINEHTKFCFIEWRKPQSQTEKPSVTSSKPTYKNYGRISTAKTDTKHAHPQKYGRKAYRGHVVELRNERIVRMFKNREWFSLKLQKHLSADHSP